MPVWHVIISPDAGVGIVDTAASSGTRSATSPPHSGRRCPLQRACAIDFFHRPCGRTRAESGCTGGGSGVQKPGAPFACAATSFPKKSVLKIMRNEPNGWPRQFGLNASNTACPFPCFASTAAAYPWRYLSPPVVMNPERSGDVVGYFASMVPLNPSPVVNAGG